MPIQSIPLSHSGIRDLPCEDSNRVDLNTGFLPNGLELSGPDTLRSPSLLYGTSWGNRVAIFASCPGPLQRVVRHPGNTDRIPCYHRANSPGFKWGSARSRV